MKMTKTLLLATLLLFSLTCPKPALAQTGTPSTGPVYIVAYGDSLLEIATKFNVSVDQIMAANNIQDPNQIFPGQQIIIPGLEDINGVLTSRVVNFGETERSVSRQLRIADAQLLKLNRIISPTEFYAGANLIIFESQEKPSWKKQSGLQPGETSLEFSIKNSSDQWTISEINNLTTPTMAIPGDVLFIPGTSPTDQMLGIPPVFQSIKVDPLPLTQGTTAQILVGINSYVSLSGELTGHSLSFFNLGNNQYASLQGIHALITPGLYPLRLDATLPSGEKQSFEQMVLIKSGNYPSEKLYVDPKSIDPAVTVPEEQLIESFTSKVSPVKLWDGIFISPASQYEATSYLTSRFGNRRTYYGIGTDLVITGFHSGMDFGGGVGLPITAPAAGVVVFTGPLDVRGNATIIDHGWGVFTGYWHQSEIKVQVGEKVDQGQVIGLVGATGRVTGAHLHWEVWVNGVQVNPMDWLVNLYPHP